MEKKLRELEEILKKFVETHRGPQKENIRQAEQHRVEIENFKKSVSKIESVYELLALFKDHLGLNQWKFREIMENHWEKMMMNKIDMDDLELVLRYTHEFSVEYGLTHYRKILEIRNKAVFRLISGMDWKCVPSWILSFLNGEKYVSSTSLLHSLIWKSEEFLGLKPF